jgi:hypothetical protein
MALDPALIPETAKPFFELLGEELALALVKAYGGLPLTVPKAPRADLIEALGETGAAALCREFGGESFNQVPKCQKAIVAERNMAMAKAVDADGASIVQVAKEHGICWMAAHRAVKRGRALWAGQNGRKGQ